jgi:hypothetical protein
VIEHHDPKSPYTPILNVTEKRAALSGALLRLIDQRIDQRIQEQLKRAQPQLQQLDPERRPR